MRRNCARLRARWRLGRPCKSGSWTTMDSEITSSPTRSMRLSSLIVSTFTKPAALWTVCGLAGLAKAMAALAVCSSFVPAAGCSGGFAFCSPSGLILAETGDARGDDSTFAIAGLARTACTLAIRPRVGTTMGGCASLRWVRSVIWRRNRLSVSPPSKIRSIVAELIVNLCWRAASSNDSSSWARTWIGVRLRKPEPPLNV